MKSGRTAQPMNPQDAIRQGLQVTYADRDKMPLEPNFYVAQLTMLNSEVRRYSDEVTGFVNQGHPDSEATIHTLHGALHDHLRHGLVLLEQAADALSNCPGAYGAWSSRFEHPFEVYKGAEQIVYGTYSGLTHVDRAPYIPTAVLRTAIEVRLRLAFGIEGYIDSTNNEFVPINLSRLFEAVHKHLP